MADTIPVNEIIAKKYEPKRQFRWILTIDGIDAYTMTSAARPKVSFGETQIDWINTRWFLSGKPTYDPISIELNDPIAPSAAQKVMEWVRLNYESDTGRSGYASYYKKDITLKLLDPPGAVVEEWVLHGSWLQNVDFGQLNYSTEDPVKITATLRYDWPQLNY